MAVAAEQCINYEINLQMCPCPSESCTRRGICCECLRAHAGSGSQTACMKGAGRDQSTMSLNAQADKDCPNATVNLEACTCTWEPCNKKGICCNCVRNHFNTSGTDRVACMR